MGRHLGLTAVRAFRPSATTIERNSRLLSVGTSDLEGCLCRWKRRARKKDNPLPCSLTTSEGEEEAFRAPSSLQGLGYLARKERLGRHRETTRRMCLLKRCQGRWNLLKMAVRVMEDYRQGTWMRSQWGYEMRGRTERIV